MSNEQETPKEQYDKFANQATIGDQDDPANWFTKIAFPSSDPKGMCRDAKKALLNCLRATDCFQKVHIGEIFRVVSRIASALDGPLFLTLGSHYFQYGYTPRECLNDKALPGRNAECDKFETMLSACKWDTVSLVGYTEIQCHILFSLHLLIMSGL